MAVTRCPLEVRIVAEECIGCAACVPECAVNAIELQDVVAAVNAEECIGCEDCIMVCPVEAIVPVGSEAGAGSAAGEPARPRPVAEPPPPAGPQPCAGDCDHEEEPFQLLGWRPGRGDLRRRLRKRLGR